MLRTNRAQALPTPLTPNNLKALSDRVIVTVIDELTSGILHLPENKIDRAGSLCRCKVTSSGISDIPIDSIVHCKAELGYRIPLTSQRIYMGEDVILIED